MLGKNNISITNMTPLKYIKYQSHFPAFAAAPNYQKKVPSNANVNNNNI
jgi:hypothetical protein